MLDRWLSPEVLEWQALEASGSYPPRESLKSRSYEMLAHAEQLLSQPPSELSLADVITTLRRAIDRRVRDLNSVYSFRSIPFSDKPSDSLFLLESLGIIRSHMLQRLIDIRNAVEHEDVAPPGHETCKVFAEFTWYFLRSTDRMLENVPDSFYFRPDWDNDDNFETYMLTVDYGPENNWKPRLWGWIAAEMLSDGSVSEWICLKVEKIETRKEIAERRGYDDAVGKSNDLLIHAEVRGPASALAKITQAYFSVI